MSNTQPFNFVTFFKVYASRSYFLTLSQLALTVQKPVINHSLKKDIVVGQKSNIVCEDDDNVSVGDYGILKNSLGFSIFFKIVAKKPDQDKQMSLDVLTGFDIVDVDVAFKGEERTEYIPNLTIFLTEILYKLGYDGALPLPFEFNGEAVPTYLNVRKNDIKKISEILGNAITQNVKIGINLNDYLFTSTIGLKRIAFNLANYMPETITLNIADTSLFANYEVQYDTLLKTVYKIVVNNYTYNDLYYCINSGKVWKCVRGLGFWEAYEVFATGIEGVTPEAWSTKTIATPNMQTVIYDWDAGKTEAENIAIINQKAYCELIQQQYDHEITAELLIDNSKIDLKNLEELFYKNIMLNINQVSYNTKITYYEYDGSNTIKVKFGKIRTTLTDKLKLKGVI